ncbi:hypothetical protein [uncultured Sulfitobacter sp.]|uniref:hypothetical protein n=1 Tax=uncultured Sulfitobacter sp. TaxID=191468 RepID=UPI0026320C3B|nr:hypothetical protein [uncultured Sulfitobacter sp.]
MATSFEERLANLESKRVDAGGPAALDLPDYSNGGAEKQPALPQRGGSSKIKMIVFGIAILAGLPAAAYFGTSYLAKSSEMFASISQTAGTISELVGKDSKMVNDYQMSRILFQYERGEITREETFEMLEKAGIVFDDRGYNQQVQEQ